MNQNQDPPIVTDVKPKTKIIPRYFQDYKDLPDQFFSIEIKRSQVARAGKGWKQQMDFLSEILVDLDKIRCGADGEVYFHLNAATLIEVIQTIMNTTTAFAHDKDIQSLAHTIHVQPYWKTRDKKRKIIGYALTHIVKITKGGTFNLFSFPVSTYLNHPEGVNQVVLPRDLIVKRYELIDCRRLAADEHLGAGRITVTPDGKDMEVNVFTKNNNGESVWMVAGKLQISWK